ncbi:MAG: glycosyltransferase [Phycisphaerales bacterium]|nr:glycosyltransferase [Phycisphaerales bacterium]
MMQAAGASSGSSIGGSPSPSQRKDKTFAVWLEQPPGMPVQGEGLMVVLANVLRSLAKRGDTRLVIGCAIWTRRDIVALLHQYGLSDSDYEVITGSKRIPFVVRLMGIMPRLRKIRKKRTPRNFGAVLDSVSRILRSRIVAGALLSQQPLLFLLALPVLILLGIVSGILLAFLAVLYSIKPIVLWLGKRIKPLLQEWLPRFYISPPEVRAQMRLWFEQVCRLEFLRMARRAKKAGVEVWYIATPGANVGMTELEARTVLAIADVVPLDFEFGFERLSTRGHSKRVITQLQRGAQRASATISYCASVRDQHAVGRLGVPKNRAFVVPHAPPFLPTRYVEDERRARALIREYLSSEIASELSWTSHVAPKYVDQLDLGKLDYVFVSSQIRPHKNTMNMLLAMETLIRRRFVSCKCVLSGELRHVRILAPHVLKHELQYDILSLPRIPSRHHAAFFRCARLAVVPTLFEGGFPFPFTESLSVGTPVLMSRIPVVEEVITAELGRLMLFDPLRPDDIADRIQWGLKHREELAEMQKPVFEKLSKRTWDHVAGEYLDIVERVRKEGVIG